nr:GNAT family N-acetyltransferase [Kineococcus indalonis]
MAPGPPLDRHRPVMGVGCAFSVMSLTSTSSTSRPRRCPCDGAVPRTAPRVSSHRSPPRSRERRSAQQSGPRRAERPRSGSGDDGDPSHHRRGPRRLRRHPAHRLRPLSRRTGPGRRRSVPGSAGDGPQLLAVTEQRRPVGTAAACSFEMTLPGAVLAPAAGVSAIGVPPSHRRRGVMTALTRRQLDDLRAREEFFAVLLASEAAICRRVDRGPAAPPVG